ncbi:hypothetical protein IEO21_08677 [Rhodonia placenta]|uniref:Cytochrome P450 n=1 Tax=Rhodonia placenta TaxID=104341 RepID=A0A8H7NVW6_9APHY|nr:hypothetical protein IEO21_08677 [Postia placenta]
MLALGHVSPSPCMFDAVRARPPAIRPPEAPSPALSSRRDVFHAYGVLLPVHPQNSTDMKLQRAGRAAYAVRVGGDVQLYAPCAPVRCSDSATVPINTPFHADSEACEDVRERRASSTIMPSVVPASKGAGWLLRVKQGTGTAMLALCVLVIIPPLLELEYEGAEHGLHDLLYHGETSNTEYFVEGPHGKVPERHWFSIIRRYMTSLMITLMYGRRVDRIVDNPRLHITYTVLSNFTHVAQPGRYMVGAFPVLRWLPDILAPWRAEGKKMHEWELKFWGKQFADSRTALLNGSGLNGIVQSYLRARTEAGLEDLPGKGATEDGPGWMRDKLMTYTAVSLIEAGSDTTSTAIFSFMLLMLSNPDALRHAKDEMDGVVGSSRMPEWEDEDRLPWLKACIKETLRCAPPLPLGIPHKADEDDVYDGYLIPKGSTVIGNIWAIHMDPVRYPDPTAFKPERFYNPDGKLNWASGPDTHNRDQYVFTKM